MIHHLTYSILLLNRGGVKHCEKRIGILELLELTGVRKFQCVGKIPMALEFLLDPISIYIFIYRYKFQCTLENSKIPIIPMCFTH